MSSLTNTNRSPEGSTDDVLAGLALDLRWAWNHSTDELWRQMNPELWELTQNPWAVLQTVSRQRLEKLNADPAFREMLNQLTDARRAEDESSRWFEETHPNSPLKTVAYFSMEYML